VKKLFTNLRNRSENNKGFSLVELIIVIAIMVALVAMLAPQFVKYVSKSRDAVITRAAEDVLSVAKAEYSLGHLRVIGTSSGGLIRVQTNAEGKLIVRIRNLTYDDGEGHTGRIGFEEMCGLDENQVSKSEKAYEIAISNSNEFASEETQALFSEEVVGGGHTNLEDWN